jgi:hypothetical protein
MAKDDRRWWTLGAVCVATFMLLIDITTLALVRQRDFVASRPPEAAEVPARA